MEFAIFIFWLCFALLVGVIGSKRNIGFFFAFIWSIVLSPIAGFIITMLSKPKKNKEQLKESILNQLDKVSSLKEKELLTEKQYETEKNELTYRLNNLDKETKSSKLPHLYALAVLIILSIIGYFGFKKYLEEKDSAFRYELEQRDKNKSTLFPNKSKSNKETLDNVTISGYATYGSDFIPEYIDVYAKNVKTNKVYKSNNFDRENGQFKIEVPEGLYYVFSTNDVGSVDITNSSIIQVEKRQNISNIKAEDLFDSGL